MLDILKGFNEDLMSVENPYEVPEVDQSQYAATIQDRIDEKLRDYQSLDEKAFKKLYYRSCNISAIAFLMVLGIVVMSGIFFLIPDVREELLLGVGFIGGLLLFQLVSAVGLILRTSWGRILGFVSCALMLTSIPIGTLIGIVGIFALAKGAELFGSNRVTHKELKAEFNLRKQQKKDAKRAAKLAKQNA